MERFYFPRADGRPIHAAGWLPYVQLFVAWNNYELQPVGRKICRLVVCCLYFLLLRNWRAKMRCDDAYEIALLTLLFVCSELC